MLEATAGHAQDAVHAFEYLAEDAGVDLDQHLRRFRIGVGGDGQRLHHVAGETVGDDLLLLLAFRHHLDDALDGVARLAAARP